MAIKETYVSDKELEDLYNSLEKVSLVRMLIEKHRQLEKKVKNNVVLDGVSNRLSQFKDDKSWDDVISGYILKNNISQEHEQNLNNLIDYLDKEYSNLFNDC